MQQVVGRCQAKLTHMWKDKDRRDQELRRGEKETKGWVVKKCKKKEAKDDKRTREVKEKGQKVKK